MSKLLEIFPFMTPYEKPVYFIVLAIMFIPSIIYSLKGKRLVWYQAFLTVLFLWMSFAGPNINQGYALIGYVLWQVILAKSYFSYRQKNNKSGWFYFSVFLAILPMILIKIIPLYSGKQPIFYFLGYSYLTFKSVQVIIEVRDGIIKELKVKDYIQFMVFFPTISSGPIDRSRRFIKDIYNPPEREKYIKLLEKGIHYIFLGCLYKFIIGYYLGIKILPAVQEWAIYDGFVFKGSIAYMYVYSLYLFFDFAGYSLFAVGTSYLLGYETPMNFNKPFLSHNIKEFWSRWHISLSTWFRDYVYMRLMLLLMKKKVLKSQVTASNISYFALFLLMGIWHGLNWYYIVYGLYHGALMCLTDAWVRYKKKHKDKFPSNKFTKGFSIFLNFNTVCFGLLLFSGYLDILIKRFA